MNDEVSATARLAAIKKAVEELVAENQRLKIENDELTQNLKDCEYVCELQKNTIGELMERAKLLKIAKALSLNGSEKFDAKIKINELIKDIDRCIDLLNE